MKRYSAKLLLWGALVIIMTSCGKTSDSTQTSDYDVSPSNPIDFYNQKIGSLQATNERLLKPALKSFKSYHAALKAGYRTMSADQVRTITDKHSVYIDDLAVLKLDAEMTKLRAFLGQDELAEGVLEGRTEYVSPLSEISSAYGNISKIQKSLAAVDTSVAGFLTQLSKAPKLAGKVLTALAIVGKVSTYIPYVAMFADAAVSVLNSAKAIGQAINNTAIYTMVSERAILNRAISVRKNEMGVISNYDILEEHISDWFTYGEYRNFLKAITGETPPSVKWTCTACTYNIKNLEPGVEQALNAYLNKHYAKLFIAFDEIRLEHGPSAFPFYSTVNNDRTHYSGASREWRYPEVMASMQAEIDQISSMISHADKMIEGLRLLIELHRSKNTAPKNDYPYDKYDDRYDDGLDEPDFLDDSTIVSGDPTAKKKYTVAFGGGAFTGGAVTGDGMNCNRTTKNVCQKSYDEGSRVTFKIPTEIQADGRTWVYNGKVTCNGATKNKSASGGYATFSIVNLDRNYECMFGFDEAS